jgi:DNA-binding FadR family transcriptional regulator
MRILETEGLVTVQRGSKGGVEVHTPSAADAAYTLGLVMTVQRVPLEDLAVAIRQLEPICAILCAERTDRNRKLVPRLRALQAEAESRLENQLAFTDSTRRFHEEIVAACQNRTLALLVGTLEALWSSHVKTLAHIDQVKGQPQSLASRKNALAEHQRILDAIAAGDTKEIRLALVGHLQRVQRKRMPSGDQMIDVAALRP